MLNGVYLCWFNQFIKLAIGIFNKTKEKNNNIYERFVFSHSRSAIIL